MQPGSSFHNLHFHFIVPGACQYRFLCMVKEAVLHNSLFYNQLLIAVEYLLFRLSLKQHIGTQMVVGCRNEHFLSKKL
jgi:hypothetical protein